MRKFLNVLLILMLCLGLVACGANDSSSDDMSSQQTSAAEQEVLDIISLEELYGTYVSTLDETVSFIFTSDEYYADENNQVITCPLYKQEQGKERTLGGVYSLEITGNVLTVVDYYGEEVPFEINLEEGNIVLKFLKEQYEGSFFDAPFLNSFLCDLVKQDNQ